MTTSRVHDNVLISIQNIYGPLRIGAWSPDAAVA